MQEALLKEVTMEQAMIEEQTNPEVSGATTFTLCILDFVQKCSISGNTLDEQNKELLQKDRLTSGLTHEIETLFLNPSEINSDDDNKVDSIAFQCKIAQLFPCGPMFASFNQIDQAADMFLLGAWAIKKMLHSKLIQCSYYVTHDKKDGKHPDPYERHKLERALNSIYKCPFIIRYGFVAYCKNRALKKPDIVNFLHTCQMATIFHRQALQKSGCLQPDLNGLGNIMSLLWESFAFSSSYHSVICAICCHTITQQPVQSSVQ
jgi:hypothetical protein